MYYLCCSALPSFIYYTLYVEIILIVFHCGVCHISGYPHLHTFWLFLNFTITNSATVNNLVCLPPPACTGVSLGYSPGSQSSGLKDVTVIDFDDSLTGVILFCPPTTKAWVSVSYIHTNSVFVYLWIRCGPSMWWAWLPFQMVKGPLCFFFCELSTHGLCFFFEGVFVIFIMIFRSSL